MFSDPEKNLKTLKISSGMKVADFGSGSGFYTLAIAENVSPKGKVYAVDIQTGLLEKIRMDSDRIGLGHVVEVVQGDLEKENGSRLASDLVDAVVLANTLFQIDEKEKCVSEAIRIIKNNGRVLVLDWLDSFGGIGPQPEDVVSKELIKKMFIDQGAELSEELEHPGDHHYGFIFVVKKNKAR